MDALAKTTQTDIQYKKDKNKIHKKVSELRKKINHFWQYCKDNDLIPDVELLCKVLGTCRQRLHEWETSEDNKEISDLIKNVKNDIFVNKKQLAFKGKLNATIFIFDAKNNHGYVDKQEHEHSNNTNVTVSFNIPKLDTVIPTKTIEGVVIEATPIKDT
jgi:hypothetical protein